MYRIIANLEEKYKTLDEAINDFSIDKYISPVIPYSHMPEEDNTIPRICVAPTLEDCINAMGILGRFRRCCAANEDGKSYEYWGKEIYPIIILEFSDNEDYYKPSKEFVPDVDTTNEYWITYPTKPISVKLKWVHPRSVIWDEELAEEENTFKCIELDLLDAPDSFHSDHPYLNAKGHFLESSKMEDDIPDEIIPQVLACNEMYKLLKAYNDIISETHFLDFCSELNIETLSRVHTTGGMINELAFLLKDLFLATSYNGERFYIIDGFENQVFVTNIINKYQLSDFIKPTNKDFQYKNVGAFIADYDVITDIISDLRAFCKKFEEE